MMGSRYTQEQNQFILEHDSMPLKELAFLYDMRFGESPTPAALGKKRRSLGLSPLPTSNGTMFTEEINRFLIENFDKFTSRELAEKISEMFGVTPKTQTVTWQLNNLGIKRGSCYKPKGYVPRASKPIGYERVDKSRTIMVKVAQPNKWKPKAQVMLDYNPKEEQVIFLDGNSLNVVPENMIVVSKKVHARLAKNGWINTHSEIILAGIKWTELFYTIKEIEKELEHDID